MGSIIDLLISDFDGTVGRTTIGLATLNFIADQLGISHRFTTKDLRPYSGGRPHHIISSLFGRYAEEACECYTQHGDVVQDTQANLGAKELFAQLPEWDVISAILTNMYGESLERALHQCGLVDLFDPQYIYCNGGDPVPLHWHVYNTFLGDKSKGLQMILDKTGIPPERVLYLGDGRYDRDPAYKLGVPYLNFPTDFYDFRHILKIVRGEVALPPPLQIDEIALYIPEMIPPPGNALVLEGQQYRTGLYLAQSGYDVTRFDISKAQVADITGWNPGYEFQVVTGEGLSTWLSQDSLPYLIDWCKARTMPGGLHLFNGFSNEESWKDIYSDWQIHWLDHPDDEARGLQHNPLALLASRNSPMSTTGSEVKPQYSALLISGSPRERVRQILARYPDYFPNGIGSYVVIQKGGYVWLHDDQRLYDDLLAPSLIGDIREVGSERRIAYAISSSADLVLYDLNSFPVATDREPSVPSLCLHHLY